MNQQTRNLVQAIHDAPGMVSLVVAGAGTGAMSALLGVAGASRTVLDIQVPYASSAVVDYAGAEPEQYVSTDAALSLARAAYRRAALLRDGATPVWGVSCTATIATDRPKRGDHRCHVSVYSATGWETSSLTFVKGLRDRDGEDAAVSALILNAVADALGALDGASGRLDLGLDDGERVIVESQAYDMPLDALAVGHIGHALIGADGKQDADGRFVGAVVSGSFNPVHRGHYRLAEVASEIAGAPAAFELSITNVDKPPLDVAEVRRRLAQFSGSLDAVVTRAPTFREKARLLPGCAFVIGADTMTRLIDPKYYGGSAAEMVSAMLEMRSLECSFLVAGRSVDGRFTTLGDVDYPTFLSDLFREIPESAFREDVSSTEIRAGVRAAS